MITEVGFPSPTSNSYNIFGIFFLPFYSCPSTPSAIIRHSYELCEKCTTGFYVFFICVTPANPQISAVTVSVLYTYSETTTVPSPTAVDTSKEQIYPAFTTPTDTCWHRIFFITVWEKFPLSFGPMRTDWPVENAPQVTIPARMFFL